MLLLDYLKSNTLISNTHGIFDYNLFKQRLIVRYGKREVREDIPLEYIAIYAQNTIDINVDYFQFLMSNVVNPFETWAENETHTNNGENTTSGTNGGTKTIAHSGDITATDGGTVNRNVNTEVKNTGTAHGENPTTSTVENNVNAYNSEVAVPHDNSKTTNTNTSDNNYDDKSTTTGTDGETRDLTKKQTFNNTDSETTTGNNSETGKFSDSGNYKKSGYNINDVQTALQMQYNAYDTIIDCVIRDILITVAEIDECDFMGVWQ